MSRFATVVVAVLVSVGLLAGTSPAQAQGLSLGVEGGVTFADLSVSDGGADLGSQTGFRVAGVARYGFGGAFGIQTGVGLSQKGAEDDTDPAATVDVDLSYIEVPLLLTLDIPTGPAPVNPRIFAGPQVSFETTCELGVEGGGTSATFDCGDQSLGEMAFDTKGTDVGLVFGGGLDFGLGGPVALTVDGRYDLGLTDINDIADPNPAEVKNRTFSASAGLLIRLP